MSCSKRKKMTVANKEKNVAILSQQCCCMCGDSGLTQQLFQCNVCHFRSQHRYCSNLYPKSESYEVCNWCLNQKVDSNSHNSSNSSPPSCNNKDTNEDDSKKKRKGDYNKYNHASNSKASHAGKPKSPEKPPPCNTTRKRIISNRRLEERSNGGGGQQHITRRHVFRNKVPRYKLLDEVSS